MTILLVGILAFLGGFALGPTHEVERLVEVQVAVPVPCRVEMPARPLMPTDQLALDAKIDVQNRHMRAEIEIRDGYEDELETRLNGCRTGL